MKKDMLKPNLGVALFFTIFYWAIGIVNFLMGGISNLTTIYGILLLISLILPTLFCLLLLFNMRPFPFIETVIGATLYVPFLGLFAVSYSMQSWLGALLVLLIIVFMIVVDAVYALFKTLTHKESTSSYSYQDEAGNSQKAPFRKVFSYHFKNAFFDSIAYILDAFL